MHRILPGQRGFSLTELLVAMAVMGLLLGGILAIQQQGLAAYVMGSKRVETQQNARVALDLLIRELRSATAVTVIGGPTDLTFTYPDDDDPTTTVPIRYQLSGTTLNRTFNGTGDALIGGVLVFDIKYWKDYDALTNSGTATTVPNEVRVVRVSLITGSEDAQGAGSMGDRRAQMESTVRLRNASNAP